MYMYLENFENRDFCYCKKKKKKEEERKICVLNLVLVEVYLNDC